VTNTKGDILIFNRGAENILGYKADEVVGKMNIRGVYERGVAKEVMEKLKSPDYGGVGKLTSFPIVHRRKDGDSSKGTFRHRSSTMRTEKRLPALAFSRTSERD